MPHLRYYEQRAYRRLGRGLFRGGAGRGVWRRRARPLGRWRRRGPVASMPASRACSGRPCPVLVHLAAVLAGLGSAGPCRGRLLPLPPRPRPPRPRPPFCCCCLPLLLLLLALFFLPAPWFTTTGPSSAGLLPPCFSWRGLRCGIVRRVRFSCKSIGSRAARRRCRVASVTLQVTRAA